MFPLPGAFPGDGQRIANSGKEDNALDAHLAPQLCCGHRPLAKICAAKRGTKRPFCVGLMMTPLSLSNALRHHAAVRLRALSERLSRPPRHGTRTHQAVAKQYLASIAHPCVYDVGASGGQWAALLLGVRADARVYSFEPGRAAFEQLTNRFRADKRVFCHAIAFGSQDGSASLGINRHQGASSILAPTRRCRDEYPVVSLDTSQELVSLRRMDSAVAELQLPQPHLVKIDVQGFEHEVIRGGPKTLTAAAVVICEVSFMELYQQGARLDEVCHQLRLLGHSLAEIYGWSLGRSGLPAQADFVFTREPSWQSHPRKPAK